MRSSSRLRTSAERRSCASSERATTSSPEVSRSSRWTMPGRSGSRRRRRCRRAASTSVPPVRPAPGMDDEAGRLVDDGQVLVLPGDPRRAALAGSGRRRRRPPTAARPARRPRGGSSSAARCRRRAPRARPPARPRRASRDGPARNRSSRSPAASAGTSSTVGWRSSRRQSRGRRHPERWSVRPRPRRAGAGRPRGRAPSAGGDVEVAADLLRAAVGAEQRGEQDRRRRSR